MDMYYYLDQHETRIPDEGATQHFDVMREMGDCYTQVGDYAQARRCYEKAIDLMPDQPEPYVGLGVVAFQNEDALRAERFFDKALELDSRCSRALCGLGMIHQQQEDYPNACDMYLRSLAEDSDNLTALLGLFQVSCQMGRFDRVIHYLEQYLDRHPADTAVMLCLATLHLRQSQPERAQKLLGDLVMLDPENEDAVNLLEEVDRAVTEKKQMKCESII